jgi:hypothetical protein
MPQQMIQIEEQESEQQYAPQVPAQGMPPQQ